MPVEWDKRKAESNLRKHKVSFEESKTVFLDPLAKTLFDPDHSSEESRWITIGYSVKGRLLVVCHTDRQDIIRIVSARRANKPELRNHEEASKRRP